MQKFLIVSLFGLTALIGFSTRVVAKGALAIGSTGNVVADGVAIGGSANDPTREGAIAAALEKCRSQPDVQKAAARCKIVRTFTGKCYAAAFDRHTGRRLGARTERGGRHETGDDTLPGDSGKGSRAILSDTGKYQPVIDTINAKVT